MQKFETGQTVICNNAAVLDGNRFGPRLKEGRDYLVKAVIQCPNCGTDHLNLGLPAEFEEIHCYDCKQLLPNCGRIAYCHPSRFSVI